MTKKTIKTIITLFVLVFVLVIPYFVFAQAPLDKVKNVADSGSGYSTEANDINVATYLGNIVAILMGLLGVIFIILLIYGGFKWMTASGDESKVKLAIDIIRRAVIGLLIVAGSYAIWQFIFNKLFL